jgi:ABC-type nitrate/sulfonate/bicarbonate transport system permease component
MTGAGTAATVERRKSRYFKHVDRGQLGRWILSIVLFFLAWELIGRSGVIISIVPPSEVLPALWQELTEGELLAATAGTLGLAAVGLLIGAVVGVSLGVAMGVSPRVSAVLDPLVSAGFSVPIALFIPAISIYVGLEFAAKVPLVLLMNIFVIILNTATGVREVPASAKEMARAFGVSGWAMYRKVIFPWASPYIVTGLRLGVGRSVQGAILADLFMRSQDLGLVIREAGGAFLLAELLAVVFFVTILAAGTMGVARIIEWRLLRWKTV